MYPYTNTLSGPNTSTETKALSLSKSYYVTKTELVTTITDLFYKLDDKIFNLDDKFMWSIKNITSVITDQDTKYVKKLKKQLQPMPLQIK